MSPSYLALLESLRVSCKLPEFPNPLPSTQFHLKLENDLTITINWHEETELVELFATIGTYAPQAELEVLRKIAQANFLWSATAGGTLSARFDIQTIYLAYQTCIESFKGNEHNEFVQLVQQFARVASEWQLLVQELSKTATA